MKEEQQEKEVQKVLLVYQAYQVKKVRLDNQDHQVLEDNMACQGHRDLQGEVLVKQKLEKSVLQF